MHLSPHTTNRFKVVIAKIEETRKGPHLLAKDTKYKHEVWIENNPKIQNIQKQQHGDNIFRAFTSSTSETFSSSERRGRRTIQKNSNQPPL